MSDIQNISLQKDGVLEGRGYWILADDDTPIQEIVQRIFKDFAHKLWILYYENIYSGMLDNIGTYKLFFERYAIDCSWIQKHKLIEEYHLSKLDDLYKTVSMYINCMVNNANLDKKFLVDEEKVSRMFGGGEFPFMNIFIYQEDTTPNNQIHAYYTLLR